jgi:hypothetical protein
VAVEKIAKNATLKKIREKNIFLKMHFSQKLERVSGKEMYIRHLIHI